MQYNAHVKIVSLCELLFSLVRSLSSYLYLEST